MRHTIILLVVALLLAVLVVGEASAAPTLSWYEHNTTVDVYGSPDCALNAYTVSISLYNTVGSSTSSLYLQGWSHGWGDICVFDGGGSVLPFWIEGHTNTTAFARLWVNVTSVPRGSSNHISFTVAWDNSTMGDNNIYMNGSTTFAFFEDFDWIGDITSTGRWTKSGGGTGMAVAGVAMVTGSGVVWELVSSVPTFSPRVAVEAYAYPNDDTNAAWGLGLCDGDSSDLAMFVVNSLSWKLYDTCAVGVEWPVTRYSVLTTPTRLTVGYYPGHATYYEDAVLVSDVTTDVPTIALNVRLQAKNAGHTTFAYWIAVRNYTLNEPVVYVTAAAGGTSGMPTPYYAWPTVNPGYYPHALNTSGYNQTINDTLHTNLSILLSWNGISNITRDFGMPFGLVLGGSERILMLLTFIIFVTIWWRSKSVFAAGVAGLFSWAIVIPYVPREYVLPVTLIIAVAVTVAILLTIKSVKRD